MRLVTMAVVLGLALSVLGPAAPTLAQKFRGLSLSTPFPTQTVSAGEPVTLTLTVKNLGLPPQVVTLSVVEAPPGWKASILGAGRPIGAVGVDPDDSTTVTLRLVPPASAKTGTFHFKVVAQGQSATASLPIVLTLGEVLPQRLALSAELPILKGSATSSFRYRLTLRNDSDRDLLVNLSAETPAGYRVTFTSAGQEVTSLPIKPGESKDIDTEVSIPKTTAAGRHEFTVRAAAGEARAELKLGLEVTGRADLSITTREGRLSGRATAGRSTPLKLVIKNSGSISARDVEVSATEPTGWEVKFEPNRIAEVAPNGEREVTALLKPSPKALAGDYMVTMRAGSGDEEASADFRITVQTSSWWGLVGILLVAVALGVVTLAVSRYGRR